MSTTLTPLNADNLNTGAALVVYASFVLSWLTNVLDWLGSNSQAVVALCALCGVLIQLASFIYKMSFSKKDT